MKLDKERQQKANAIKQDIIELLSLTINHKDTLTNISNIICELDTDIAINVMKQINTEESLQQELNIKIKYGY